MTQPIIQLSGVDKFYGDFQALSQIDLDIRTGEFFSLLGPSGCGKTTLLRSIAGFETPSAGSLHIDGASMDGVPANKRPTNMVFQSYAIFPHMSVAERMQPATTFQPEVASLNMGSMNFGLYPMLDRFDHFTHTWERENLENSRDLVFKNTFQDIETILRIGNENGTRFEFECYDISHLYNLAHFVDRGLAKTPLFIQIYYILSKHI